MRFLVIILFSIPFFCFSEESDSTSIKVISSKFDSSLNANDSKLELLLFSPNGKPASRRDIVVIIGKDTICYNSNNIDFLNTSFVGKQKIQVRSKWWQSTIDSIEIKPQNHVVIEIHFAATPFEIKGIIYGYNKPVIYLYPEKTQEIKVNLKLKGKLTFTYPKHKDGWIFTATKDGTLNFKGKNYNYLFWEGDVDSENVNINLTKGFVVSSDSLVNFFEEILAKIGLSSQEQQDFITYWYPQMKDNEKVFMHFIFNEEYNEIANLSIIPKPDNFIRLFMYWQPIRNLSIDVGKQNIPNYSRKGFTVVEWGGSEIPKAPNYSDSQSGN